ncbi:MAG: carboxypeptidase-like regulatory domain-containing protein [Gemmatimonadaceae bacterium]
MRLLSLSSLLGGTWRSFFFLSAALLVSACGDDLTAPVPTVSGTVLTSATGNPVEGAQVSIGTTTVTTGADGRFTLTDLAPGSATLRTIATGFEVFEKTITVPLGNENISVELTRVELLEFGDFTVYVPATVSKVRGVLLALGGPNTRGFASAKPFGAPVPAVEASLQDLGQKFRALAASQGLAVLGTSRAAMANSGDSDQILLNALQDASAKSGRPELASAPLLLYGLSGGGPEASGFAARNPARVAGLFLKVPARMETLTSGNILGVPTFVVLAELETFVDNAMLAAAFRANRRVGALWALALEPGVPHHSLTPAQREITTLWMSTILALRLGTTSSAPLRDVAPSSGWLGDIASGEVAQWSEFPDPSFGSWFPSKEIAEQWKTFAKHRAPPGFSLRVTPASLTVRVGSAESFVVSAMDETGGSIGGPLVTVASQRQDVAQAQREVVCPMGCFTAARVAGIAVGTTTIMVGYGGLTASATVTVVP